MGTKVGEPTAQQGDWYADTPKEGTAQLYSQGGREQGEKSSLRLEGQNRARKPEEKGPVGGGSSTVQLSSPIRGQ